MPESSLWQKNHFWNFWGKTIWENYGKRTKWKRKRRVPNQWNHIRKKRLLLIVASCRLWTLKPKLRACQIWTLTNNFDIVLVCAKCPKLITLEENIIGVQKLPLCLPFFFASSSEVLNNGIKSCFDGVVFQDAVCEECF